MAERWDGTGKSRGSGTIIRNILYENLFSIKEKYTFTKRHRIAK